MLRSQALYLQVGDRVYHKHYARWGMGIVVEERTSELPGGFCYVRINFNDGNVRVFDNNLKSECCCYYAGIEIIESKKKSIDVDIYEESEKPQRKRKALTRGKG